ncbi:MAG TPA: hypothetical protein VG097_00015 [Gemmata sp.]|nr:hypothetical protein [Gemmata sp.]
MLQFTAQLVFTILVAQPPNSEFALPGFRKSPWFDELVREQVVADDVRALANAPAAFDPKKPTRLVIYATPNGSTIEQTLGCAAEGLDWHFDIQHVAAQIRRLREVSPNENVVLVCLEAEGLSWPAWKRKYTDAPARIHKVIEAVRHWVPGEKVRLSMTAHSGGGSFLFGLIDGADAIPDFVERIVFLDANYSYSDIDKHGDKLLAWLKGDRARRLVAIAYDDRKVTLNNKLVVGPDGGTFRATDRMHARFARDAAFSKSSANDIDTLTAMDGHIALLVHSNPKNIILHTALVGDMNGLLRGLTDPDAMPSWGKFGGPRAYSKCVQPAPGIPKRHEDAIGGKEFFNLLDKFPATEREEAIGREILKGNIPEFLRTFQQVTIRTKDSAGKEHTAVIEVMPDYLAIGSDKDFVRVPMTPKTAARIADAFGCSLPTRKVVDEAYRAATVKLEPKPLTEERELPGTFLRHNSIIEEQFAGKKLGELVAGIKKDVVVTNRLAEKPNRVAIYGWHMTDGKAIQPLTIVHVESYIDYSHGVRLMRRIVTVDGKPWDVRQILYSTNLCELLSDEGPLTRLTY